MRNKGSKYHPWLRKGIHESRKHYKKMWARKIRHQKIDYVNGCHYKKFKGEEEFNYID